jgi:chorismate mutase
MSAGKLEKLRKEIDEIDECILRLMLRRRDVASKIFKAKEMENLPPRDAEREKELLEGMKEMAVKSGLPEDYTETIFMTLIKICLEGAE